MEVQKSNPRRGSLATGLFIIVLGGLWLFSRMGLELPGWLFSWKSLLIFIGFLIGLDHKFSNPASYILMLIGWIFLLQDFLDIPFRIMDYFWPTAVILVGVLISWQALRGKRAERFKAAGPAWEAGAAASWSDGERLQVLSILNGHQRQIRSQRFMGGEAVAILGSAEIDLREAILAQSQRVEVTAVMASIKLLIPAHWQLQNEVVGVLSSVEEQRGPNPSEAGAPCLILQGTAVMGSIEIRSY